MDIDATPIGHVIGDANRRKIWPSKEKKKMLYFPNPTNFPQNYFLIRGE